MICPKCTHENRDDAKYCDECGFPLSERDAQPASEQAAVGEHGAPEKQDASPAATQALDSVAAEAAALGVSSSADTADFSGLERLVDSGYAPPAPSWGAGDTVEMPAIKDGEATPQKTFQAPDPNAKKRHPAAKRALIALGVVVVLALAAAGITYAMELWGGKTVPEVEGDAQNDAVWVLEDKGFTVRIAQVKSDEVEGIVLSTDPAAGSRLEVGSEIVVSVSVSRTVPNVVGKTREQAEATFKDEGFEKVAFTETKSNEPEGTVLSVSPEANTKVKAATPITVEVAVPFTVPDVAGMSQADAKSALEAEGYTVEVATSYSEDVEEGTALSTDPVAGSKLDSGSQVTLTVAKSRAKELVNATYNMSSLKISGVTYEISEVASASWQGNSTTSFKATARKVEVVNTVIFGEYKIYGDYETISGTIVWASDNSISSVNLS